MATDWTIQARDSIDVPPQTLVTDESEDSRLGSNEYTLEMIKTATPGESVEVNVNAPDDTTEYQVELRDKDLNLVAAGSPGQKGNSTETFDTSGFDPGLYLFAPIVDGAAMAVLPLIIEGYDAEITAAPSTMQSDEVLDVTASITDAVQSPPAIEDVTLFGFTDSDDTGLAVRMDNTSGDTYEVSVTDPEADQYQLHVAPRGGETFSFSIESGTMEISGNQPLGLSPGWDLTVELAPSDELETVWSRQTGSEGGFATDVSGRLQFSRPAMASGYLYVGGLDEFVTAHATNSGEQQWQFERDGNLSDSSPIVVNGTVYVGSGGGKLYALDAASGSENWSQDVGSAITSTPAVLNDTVFFGTNDGRVLARDDTASGSIDWETSVDGPVYSDLAASDGLVYVTTRDGDLVVLDATNGTEQWSASFSSVGASSPTLGGGRVYVASDEVYAYDAAASKSQRWSSSGYGGTAGSNPVLDSGVIYVGDEDGTVWGLDADTGDSVLESTITGPVSSSPAVVGDRIVVGAPDGLYVLSRYTGDIVGTRSGAAIRSDPIVKNDNVYVGTETGEVLHLQNLP